jgi:hypothetical protein
MVAAAGLLSDTPDGAEAALNSPYPLGAAATGAGDQRLRDSAVWWMNMP